MPNEEAMQISVFSKVTFRCLSGGEQLMHASARKELSKVLFLSINLID